ncbi:MAG: hypothetical protein EGP87_09205 [Paraprevotella clara]|nr:hypothetical protein [Paraprevotella clara]
MPETSLKHPSSRNILYHNLLSYNLKDEGSFLQNLGECGEPDLWMPEHLYENRRKSMLAFPPILFSF